MEPDGACTACHGLGEVPVDWDDRTQQPLEWETCPRCKGEKWDPEVSYRPERAQALDALKHLPDLWPLKWEESPRRPGMIAEMEACDPTKRCLRVRVSLAACLTFVGKVLCGDTVLVLAQADTLPDLLGSIHQGVETIATRMETR